MAQVISLVDDMDGTEAQTRYFSVGDARYAIELSDDNYKLFLEAIEPWRSIARVGQTTRQNNAPVLSREDRVKIRAWAIANGHSIADRGRFPNYIVQAFYDAQGQT
jgi:hypothetical protein